jgi:hypothetical protein
MDGRELKRTLAVHNLIARAYADDRFPSPRGMSTDLRMFTVTILWVVGIEQKPKGERWTRVCEVMHLNGYRFWEAIRADLPRYEPEGWHYQGGECEAPMIRRGGLCGKRATTAFQVTDPKDGTWRMAGFCNRHEEYSRQVDATERARQASGTLPVPLPNAGGLLPCYVGFRWPDLYAKVDPHWKPPAQGICADDWPVMAKVTAMEPPRLAVIAGERTRDASPIPQGERSAPSLRLVRDDG